MQKQERLLMETSEKDKKCSDKKMEGDKDLMTLECLRGRLLAERQASRIAKEDSERMGNKLVELENMLKQEIKLRNKAEKKLKLLKKKLESLNISSILMESDQSSTSEKSEVSSSSACCASEENESDCNVTNSVTSQESINSNNKKPDHESPHNGTTSSSNSSTDLRSSGEKNETDHEDYVDNSLALVPVSLPEASVAKIETTETKPVHENVAQVLDSLRYIREKIQSSMEMRHMVRVGPT